MRALVPLVISAVPQAAMKRDVEQDRKYTGNTNAWTLLSADDELGMLIPTGLQPRRYGDTVRQQSLRESLICLMKTGKRIWHCAFTMVSGIMTCHRSRVCDITVGGRRIKARPNHEEWILLGSRPHQCPSGRSRSGQCLTDSCRRTIVADPAFLTRPAPYEAGEQRTIY